MEAREECPRGNGGSDRQKKADDPQYSAFTQPPHAWRRWAKRADLERLTPRQALAAVLIRVGAAETPEAALRLLEGAK